MNELPLRLVNEDGHVWIECTEKMCEPVKRLGRLSSGALTANGNAIEAAVLHCYVYHEAAG